MPAPPGYFSGVFKDPLTEQEVWAWLSANIAEIRPDVRPADQPCLRCPPACESVFERVVVDRVRRGPTRVMWELRSDFPDPAPYVFQLQRGRSNNNFADDWEDVGAPVANMLYAVDGAESLAGSAVDYTHYRVKLMTSQGSYISEPVGYMGVLAPRDRRIAREIMRQEHVRMRQHAGQLGYLLKRRTTGEPCPRCTDAQTGEVRDPDCPVCWGVGLKCGYYYPVDCVWADIDPRTYNVKVSSTRGTVEDIAVRARMIGTWMVSARDIWVNRDSDDRYYVHRIQHVAELRGVPLIANVELRPAPDSDVAYDIPTPKLLDELEGI